jgi:hypothetical protein
MPSTPRYRPYFDPRRRFAELGYSRSWGRPVRGQKQLPAYLVVLILMGKIGENR